MVRGKELEISAKLGALLSAREGLFTSYPRVCTWDSEVAEGSGTSGGTFLSALKFRYCQLDHVYAYRPRFVASW